MTASNPSGPLSGFIDLHSHTNESDGTFTPEELVLLAKSLGLSALAITDHDTFEGYEKAVPAAREAGLDLVRGIELNTRLNLNGDSHKSLHLLAYFPVVEPAAPFSSWLLAEQVERRNRNHKLVESLRERGVDITLQEVEAKGRSLASRPHFARILVEKGYAADQEDAFLKYIGENAPAHVERQSHTTEEAIEMVREAHGIPVIAHPIRLMLTPELERIVLTRLKGAGLLGLEVYHSEHSAALQARYRRLASDLDLIPTGGSDFHGANKTRVHLGTGTANNIRVPLEFLDTMRQIQLNAG